MINIGNLTNACVADKPDNDLLSLLGDCIMASLTEPESIFSILSLKEYLSRESVLLSLP